MSGRDKWRLRASAAGAQARKVPSPAGAYISVAATGGRSRIGKTSRMLDCAVRRSLMPPDVTTELGCCTLYRKSVLSS